MNVCKPLGTGMDAFFDVVLVDEAGQMTLPAAMVGRCRMTLSNPR